MFTILLAFIEAYFKVKFDDLYLGTIIIDCLGMIFTVMIIAKLVGC